MISFTEEQVKEFKDCFDLNDSNKDGKLNIKEMINVIRVFGHEIDEEEMNDILDELGIENKESMNFQQFLIVMNKRAKDADIQVELIEAFKIFDKENKGVIPTADFKHLLLTLGEILGDDKIEELVYEADKNGDGFINYVEFAKNMLSKY